MEEKILEQLSSINDKLDRLLSFLESARFEQRMLAGTGMSAPQMPSLPGVKNQAMPGAGNFGSGMNSGPWSANFNVEDMKKSIEEKIRTAQEEAEARRKMIESQAGIKS